MLEMGPWEEEEHPGRGSPVCKARGVREGGGFQGLYGRCVMHEARGQGRNGGQGNQSKRRDCLTMSLLRIGGCNPQTETPW